jgi:hypothetical protein
LLYVAETTLEVWTWVGSCVREPQPEISEQFVKVGAEARSADRSDTTLKKKKVSRSKG